MPPEIFLKSIKKSDHEWPPLYHPEGDENYFATGLAMEPERIQLVQTDIFLT